MQLKRPIAIALGIVVLIGAVAAVGAASPPAVAQNENAPDVPGDGADDAAVGNADDADEHRAGDRESGARENATDRAGDPAMAAENGDGPGSAAAADRAGTVGPADGLPAQVPDHGSGIHDTIESYLDGSIDHLGDALSELLSGGTDADPDASDEVSGNASDGVDRDAPDDQRPERGP